MRNACNETVNSVKLIIELYRWFLVNINVHLLTNYKLQVTTYCLNISLQAFLGSKRVHFSVGPTRDTPQKCFFPWGFLKHRSFVPTGSLFHTTSRSVSLYFTMGRQLHHPQKKTKMPLPSGDRGSDLILRIFLGQWSGNSGPSGISVGSRLMKVTNRHTDK